MATGESISGFFERLGFPLVNTRTSWGAVNGNAVLLRSWDDEVRLNPWRVLVLRDQPRAGKVQRFGRSERKAHLRAAWRGDVAMYTVMVAPKFDKQGERSIGPFDAQRIFPVEGFVEEDGSIYALYGQPISIERLGQHMQQYRTPPTVGPMPTLLADATDDIPADPAAKAEYLAAEVREYLIAAARRAETVSYADLFAEFNLDRFSVRPVLGTVGNHCLNRDEPVLTALVVYKDGDHKGQCGPGFWNEFQVDEVEERARCFQHWNAARPSAEARVDWTDEGLEASVEGYREMMSLEAAGKPYVKALKYRQLAERFGRAEGAFERLMQNISYLLDARGLRWLQGLKPQANVGVNVEPRLLRFLEPLFEELAPTVDIAEELGDLAGVVEGAKRQITVNAYERDPSAKARCVKRWGCVCVACGFDFSIVYGVLGEGFIHVHHLKPIHTIGEAYVLMPEEDLRPVCPNCHAMLHRKKDVLSIEDLQSILKARRAGDLEAPVGT